MDKSTYLKQLKTALRQKYPEPQVRDILSDYEDFFTSGEAEGKSEAELCTEFGPPEQAARELEKENAVETCPSKKKWSVPVIALLVIFIAAILSPFFIPKFQVIGTSVPQGPVNFWLTMLFPLALESILVLWPSQSSSPQKALNWIPRVGIAFAVLTTAVLALLIFYTFWIPQGVKTFATEGLFGTTHVLMAITYCGTAVSEILLLVLVVLLILFAMRGHKEAHWFLFLDTAMLALFLNFTSFLSSIGSEYHPVSGVLSCFLWAVLPNLAAAGIYWAILKIASIRKVRGAKAWTDR